MLAEILKMSTVERIHGRMIYNILQNALDSGVNTKYYDPMKKYRALAYNNTLRIAHYPMWNQLVSNGRFTPSLEAVLESPQGGRIRTQKMTFNIFDTLYESYTNDWCRLNVKDLEYHNRIYIGVYE